MLGHDWYNEQIKRYVTVFGTMFNDILLTKKNQDGTIAKQVRVPISFGPKERWIIRRNDDPNLDRPYAIDLPAMAFEMTGMVYDGPRKLQTSGRYVVPNGEDKNKFISLWQPVPYDLTFQLSIMAKSYDDGCQIVEQILPFFTPDWTNEVILINDPEVSIDVPLILNAVGMQDTYEDGFKERRMMIWTLDFTMKCYFFGPTYNKKIIKIADVNMYDKMDANNYVVNINMTPGMTANGEPTTDPSKTIPPLDIEAEDNWAYIVQVTEKP